MTFTEEIVNEKIHFLCTPCLFDSPATTTILLRDCQYFEALINHTFNSDMDQIFNKTLLE